MIIDTKTRTLSGLIPEDIGTSVTDVLITCKAIIYRNEGNPFQVFSCSPDISCSTSVPLQVTPGITYKVSGKVTDYRGRPQLSITSIEALVTEELANSIRAAFLAAFFEKQGMTAKTAGKIADKYGEEFIDMLMNNPQDVALAVKGFSESKAVAIGEELVLNHSGYLRYLDFMMAGLSAGQAKKCDRRRDITPEDITKNPFCLSVLDAFGFEECEAILAGRQIDPLDKYRVFAAIRSVTASKHASTASTYFTAGEIEKQVRRLVIPKGSVKSVNDMFPSAFELACEFGVSNGTLSIYRFEGNKCIGCDIRSEGARIALSRYFKAEAGIKREIERFVRAKFVKPSDTAIDSTIRHLTGKHQIVLDPRQEEALKLCMYRPIVTVTGGPGTGKTTIMGILASYFEEKNIRCVYAAPTGRAAKRLSEVTGQEAFTLHRLLEACADPESETGFFFRKGPEDPIDARVIVVDEMSMVDTILFREFLSAVGKGTSVILIGDPEQLPSVGCGNVLSDLLTCSKIPCVRLDTIHRQTKGGDIPTNSLRILKGEEPVSGEEFDIISCTGEEEALIRVCEIYEELMSRPDADVIVLSPTKQAHQKLGTAELNNTLQLRCHSVYEASELTGSGYGRFLTGDRVMQIKNNYSLEYFDASTLSTGEGVYNGEIGEVIEKNDIDMSLSVRFEDGKTVKYKAKELDNLELAYAVTVHKAQGCEFDECIVVLGRMNHMLMRRNILYTAVTRGRKKVTVIDAENTLKGFLTAPSGNVRNTSLRDLLAIIDHKDI